MIWNFSDKEPVIFKGLRPKSQGVQLMEKDAGEKKVYTVISVEIVM